MTEAGPMTTQVEAPTGPSPSVSVLIPTCNRPELLRRAIDSVLDQDYSGPIEVIVVFDRSEPDSTLVERSRPGRTVHVMTNRRSPGLAGARNTGILAAAAELVAFCDDDDHWLPAKLGRQVAALQSDPSSEFASTAMYVDYDGRLTPRTAGRNRVTHQDLIRSRMAMLHSSSFLARRTALRDGIGLVDEELPRSMSEDWDLLLRASSRRPIVHVDEPLVRITWGATSYFAQDWGVRNAAQLRLLEKYPEIASDGVAAGHAYGKLAFGCAAQGQRRQALRWARRSLRARAAEPRAYLALAVASGILDWRWLLKQLNARGHGV